jgi:hypothetical protein
LSASEIWEDGEVCPGFRFTQSGLRLPSFLTSDDAAFMTGQALNVDGETARS